MTGILWRAITVSILRGFSIICCRHFIALCGSPLSSNAVWFYHDALRLSCHDVMWFDHCVIWFRLCLHLPHLRYQALGPSLTQNNELVRPVFRWVPVPPNYQ